VLSREKRRVLTGGLILITLGILILLNSMGAYSFAQSWPILLLVVALGTLLQNERDKGGWFIALIGVLFLIKENWYRQLGEYTNYAVPLILIVIGVYVLIRKR
jgi:putative Mn2+ efflux pump MntP